MSAILHSITTSIENDRIKNNILNWRISTNIAVNYRELISEYKQLIKYKEYISCTKCHRFNHTDSIQPFYCNRCSTIWCFECMEEENGNAGNWCHYCDACPVCVYRYCDCSDSECSDSECSDSEED